MQYLTLLSPYFSLSPTVCNCVYQSSHCRHCHFSSPCYSLLRVFSTCKLFWLWLRNAFSAFCSAVVLGLMSKLLCASAPEYIFDEGLGQRVKPNLRLYYQVQCSTCIGSLPWSHGSLDSCKSTYLEWKRIFVGVLMEYNSFQLHCTWTPLLT